jgi:anti-anti-sigma factor
VNPYGARSEGFSASLEFFGDQAVLDLRGVLDELAVPGLAFLLDSVIGDGHAVVVVELAELDSMTAAGAAVMAGAGQRIAGRDGRLVIRSPSPAVRRLLAEAGLPGATQTHSADLIEAALGPEQAVGAHPDRRPVSGHHGAGDLVHDLRTASAGPSNSDVLDGSLRLVVALTRATVGGADGVSVSLRRHGRLSTVAASDQTISDMDASQYATGEGPCVDASVKGRWFHVGSLDTETRWPAFIPRAKALGINAILSSPLMAADVPVGSINIYSRTVSAFESADQQLASIFANEASAILTDAGMDLSDEERAARFQDALFTREVIAQAQGVLMERDGMTEDAAYTALRIHSQRTGQPLHRRAQDVTASTRRKDPRAAELPLGPPDDRHG